MSLYGMFQGVGPSGFGYNSTADEVTEGTDLIGLTYLLTGANSGLGLETLRVLTSRGAQVIAVARTLEKAETACSWVEGDTIPIACELSEPSSVREAVKAVRELGPLDGIIANAGIMALPKREVKHGLELQFLTNHVGHFILVTGLVDRLSNKGRVVMLSSRAHLRAYDEGIRLDDLDAAADYTALGAYGQSKLANLLFAKHLATRLPHSDQTANSLHPGVIATNLTRHINPLMISLFSALGPALALKSVPQGAATQCYLAAHSDAAPISGEYFSNCNVAQPSANGQDASLAAALWERTEELVAGLA
jgi:WW domain-containing oxidoreductase